MNNSETDALCILDKEHGGDYEMSDRTLRTVSGVMGSVSDAGEQKNALREEEFRALMEGEYKDLFTAYFQQTFNRRFKEYKQIKAELDGSRAVLDALRERYGELSGDALLSAIRAETGLKNAPAEAQAIHPETVAGSFDEQIRHACDETERRVLSHIRARGMRPAENGVHVPSTYAPCTARMTREERAELARRAERGERIVL